MKKKGVFVIGLLLVSILLFSIASSSMVSASWLSDLIGKLFGSSGVTGNVIADTTNLVSVNWTSVGSGNGFTIKASADLNNDGRDEVILQNALGNIGYWTLNSSGYPIGWKVINESVYASNGSATNWYTFKLNAAGKVNGANILIFQDLTMRVAYWTLNSDAKPILWTDLGLVQPAWTVGAVAGNNSVTKIFIENEAGDVGYWNMNSSGYPAAWNTISNAGTFKIVAAADINKDGIKDIFFQDLVGQVAYWIIGSNGLPTSWNVINTSALSSDWLVRAVAEDSDNTFIYLQNARDGTVGYWTMGFKTSTTGTTSTPTSTPTCNDSDGGLNYYYKGTLNSTNLGTQVDLCAPYIDNLAHLTEYYCNGTTGAVQDYICPSGCSNGACSTGSVTIGNCTDSDGGLNYYVYGNVTTTGLGTSYDVCVPSTTGGLPNSIKEYYCNASDSNAFYYNTIECPNGCLNGSCIATNSAPSTTNLDSFWVWVQGNCSLGTYDRYVYINRTSGWAWSNVDCRQNGLNYCPAAEVSALDISGIWDGTAYPSTGASYAWTCTYYQRGNYLQEICGTTSKSVMGLVSYNKSYVLMSGAEADSVKKIYSCSYTTNSSGLFETCTWTSSTGQTGTSIAKRVSVGSSAIPLTTPLFDLNGIWSGTSTPSTGGSASAWNCSYNQTGNYLHEICGTRKSIAGFVSANMSYVFLTELGDNPLNIMYVCNYSSSGNILSETCYYGKSNGQWGTSTATKTSALCVNQSCDNSAADGILDSGKYCSGNFATNYYKSDYVNLQFTLINGAYWAKVGGEWMVNTSSITGIQSSTGGTGTGPTTACSSNNKCSDTSTGTLRCFNVGYRLSSTATPTYCGSNLQFTSQKIENATCSQHYECQSNYCGNGHCIDLLGQQQQQTNILSKILCYLRRFFLGSNETCG